MKLTQEQIDINRIFSPHAFEKQVHVSEHKSRFVQYTTAEAAMNILRSKEVWMRKSNIMNDFMETEHGLNCLSAAYTSEGGAKLKATLDREFPDFSADLEQRFNGWIPYFKNDTYLTSISEHLDSEDQIGRLSMWRAYGGLTGVAIVVRSEPFVSVSNALRIYSSPVAYLSTEQFKRNFLEVVGKIEANAELMRKLGREVVMNHIFSMFRFAMLCTKHPGFHEEREWRVIYTPAFDKSERVVKELRVIRGTPQPIFKIPLQNVPDEGLRGVSVPEFVERIIIGPTQYPAAIWEAFVALLSEAGVSNAPDRVRVSDIPLRQT
jgi:hypothetical protein